MAEVYIAGSHVLSALADPDQLGSAQIETVAARLLEAELDIPFLPVAGQPLYNNPQRMQNMTRQVLEQAIAAAGWGQAQLDDCAIFLGSTSFSLYDSEQLYKQIMRENRVSTTPLTITSYTMLPDFIRRHFAPRAQLFTFNTACTAAANALLYAGKMIRSGQIRHAIVVGLEFFNETTLLGFHSLGLISKSRQMQPFGAARDGLTLGEGCSAVLLSAEPPASGPCWQLAGGATIGDNHSMTAANPDGSSIVGVMRQALDNCRLVPADIRAAKLHGTASLANDDVESLGMRLLFGDALPPACVLKPAIGHTLGSCGTNELVLLLGKLNQGVIPGLPRDYPLDPGLDVNLSAADRPVAEGAFLLNYFGFGGNNTSLIIRNAS